MVEIILELFFKIGGIAFSFGMPLLFCNNNVNHYIILIFVFAIIWCAIPFAIIGLFLIWERIK